MLLKRIWVMRNVVVSVLVFVAFVLQGRAIHGQNAMDMPDWLELIETTRIPLDGVGPHPVDVDVDHRGNVGFVTGDRVWYYSARSESLMQLDTEDCRPGSRTRGPLVRFTPDGEILVTNAASEYFWFDLEGRCRHYRVGKDPRDEYTTPLPGRQLAHITDTPEGGRFVRVSADGEMLQEVLFDELPMPLRSMQVEGGGLIVDDGLILWAAAASSTVAAYDVSTLKLVWTQAFAMEGLTFPDSDLRPNQTDPFSMSLIDDVVKYAAVHHLTKLSDGKYALTAGHSGSGSATVQVFDGTGKPLWQSKLPQGHGLLKGDHGTVHFRYADGSDDLVIRTYQLKQ